jgi:uncharacterized protein YigE (DUF2233 family)
MLFNDQYKKLVLTLAASAGILFQPLPGLTAHQAVSIGVVNPVPAASLGRIHLTRAHKLKAAVKAPAKNSKAARAGKSTTTAKKQKADKKGKKAAAVPMPKKPPQEAIDSMSQTVLAPGVVHKCHRGALNINIVDVDLSNPNIEVKPILAGDTFNRLDEVRDQAHKVNAIAAVNANYFKKDGTPLGTLVIDGEWIAGPLYDRISFGLADNGKVHVDRANLHGTIETSNPNVACMWVNNINQPRRTGCKLVAYTRRWGSQVKMAYEGCLVAVDSSGRVTDKALQQIAVPYGGFVLSDTKKSPISKLQRGDLVFLEWHHRPDSWADVVQAVSGGPGLIRNGKLYVDLKDENFRKTWTSSSIHARTALGVTRNNHLILATIEGPHTLWDVAKMLQRLGCVDAMNLDGGGSTTMVINGNIVTRNRNSFQRRVAASLAVLPRGRSASIASKRYGNYVPQLDLPPVLPSESGQSEACLLQVPVADPVANEIHERIMNGEPTLEEAKAKADAELAEAEKNAAPLVTEPPELPKKKSKLKSIKLKNFGWMKGFMNK